MGLTPPIISPCAPITKTGNTECQGVGRTQDEAHLHAITYALNLVELSRPVKFDRCPIQCPLRTISPPTPGVLTITEEGEFDLTSPFGTSHFFYVKGSLAWTITRTCSKLQIAR